MEKLSLIRCGLCPQDDPTREPPAVPRRSTSADSVATERAESQRLRLELTELRRALSTAQLRCAISNHRLLPQRKTVT